MKPIEWIRGRSVIDVERDAGSTTFHFDCGGTLRVECFWRIIARDRVFLSSEDDQQSFGLETPIDAAPAAFAVLAARPVTAVSVAADTDDLVLEIADSIRLECIRDSSGCEAWQLTAPDGAQLIAKGGGGLAERARAT